MKYLILIIILMASPCHAVTINLNAGEHSASIGFKEQTPSIGISGNLKRCYNGVECNEGQIRLDYDTHINNSPVWYLWLDQSAGFNKPLIEFESFTGIGATRKWTHLSLSLGYLYHYIITETDREGLNRLSGRFKYKRGGFLLVSFYQPNTGDMRDYIFTFTPSLTVKKSDRFSLKAKLDYRFRSDIGQEEWIPGVGGTWRF